MVESTDKDNSNTDTGVVTKSAIELEYESQITEEDQESGRLFVRNIPYQCSEEELSELLSVYGVVSEIHMPISSKSSTNMDSDPNSGSRDTNGDPESDSIPLEQQEIMTDGMIMDAVLNQDGGESLKAQYNKGYAFVQFLFPECAKRAIASIDGTSFQGRVVEV